MQISALLSKRSPGKDWEYFSICGVNETRFIEHSKDEFELVVLVRCHLSARAEMRLKANPAPFQANECVELNVKNITMDGRSGYATSDLLRPHPTKPGLWKIVGRKDDQIMHSTGEKTNPGPLGTSFALLENFIASFYVDI